MPSRSSVQRELEKLPRVTGGGGDDIGITSRLNRLLGQAEDEAKKLKDDYVSVEHFLLAMLDDNGPAGKILKEFGVTRARFMTALQAVPRPSARHHRRIPRRPTRPWKSMAGT